MDNATPLSTGPDDDVVLLAVRLHRDSAAEIDRLMAARGESQGQAIASAISLALQLQDHAADGGHVLLESADRTEVRRIRV